MPKDFKRFAALATSAVLVGVFSLAGAAFSPRPAAARSLSTSVLGLFPKDIGEIGYADMKAARKFPWFPALREQIIPSRFRQFEQFLTSAGIDPNTEVDELAWAAIAPGKDNEQIMGVALGEFSPTSAEERLKQKKVASVVVHGFHLYASGGSGTAPGDILFFFIDSNTAAFGHRSALEKMIDVRFGAADSLLHNDKLVSLINEANGNGVVWAVLDHFYTQLGMHQLLPQADDFPQAAAILKRVHAMEVNVQADTGVDAHFQAICDSVDDANTLAAALQAGIMYRRYQEAQTNPALSHALDNVTVTPTGDRLRIEVPVTQDQMGDLVHNRSFAVPM